MMRTANPALNKNTFMVERAFSPEDRMTINGTVHKTAFLLVLALVPAMFVWSRFFEAGNPQAVSPFMLIGVFGGLIAAMVTIFKRTWAPVTAPVYAVLEGLFLGGISAVFEARFPGIVIQAIALTFGTLLFLLFAYRSGMIKPTENFKLGVVAATGGIFFVYLITFVVGLFGVNVGFIHSSGPVGIIFSLFVVVVAALNLVLDFDFIEQGAESGAPKYLEWYAAFGLMVTLVWLYIEILRLLSKLQSRR